MNHFDEMIDSRPMKVMSGPRGEHLASEGAALGEMVNRAVEAGPMNVVGGVQPIPVDNQITPKYVGDDKDLLARTAHVRLKNEKLMQFYARTGLGPTQILTMTKDEISRFVEVASANAANDPAAIIGQRIQPKATPTKIQLGNWRSNLVESFEGSR